MLTPLAIIRSTDAAAAEPIEHATVVHHRGLAVVATPITDHASDPARVMELVDEIHTHAPCVPLRGDGQPSDAPGLVRFLRAGSERLRLLLDRFEDCDEWSLSIEPGHTPTTPGETTHRGGRCYLEQRRARYDEDAGIEPHVSDWLSELTARTADVVRDHRAVGGVDGSTSLRLLIHRSHNGADALIASAGDAALPTTITGPWPPYSFATLAK
ncbi:MAG: GvpL/GvpF family gas vesicle protein [Planctomycetota bacterium]